MKRIGLLLGLLFVTTCSFAFEGIIHCTKTENGVTTTFDFYVKGDKVVVISTEGVSEYRLILDRGAREFYLCMDVPTFDTKGYYLYSEETMKKNEEITLLKQMKTDALIIDGESCDGYTVVTDNGTAIAYFGSDEVDISGFSTYLSDPVYELIDALNSKFLPRKLVVSKNTGSYTIDLIAEEQTLDNSLFNVPEGYEQFKVVPEGLTE